MKKVVSAILSLLLLVFCHLSFSSTVSAAELLDVKPAFEGGIVTVEITADIPMTYSFYKVPGQARAVVDIADADPEKVEPLIVVNKGAVSSISVDKAQISGMVVSRIIFNLVTEMEPDVTAAPDRKSLKVTFGSGTPASATPVPAPQPSQPVIVPPPPAPEKAPAPPAPTAGKEEDPLGLDDAAPKKEVKSTPTDRAEQQPVEKKAPARMEARPPAKIEPVVPTVASNAKPVVRSFSVGAGYIDVEANGPIAIFKTFRLKDPERLVIDIPEGKSSMAAKAVVINKHGVAKVRVGTYPTHVRLVLDSSQPVFPACRVNATDFGLRISLE